MKTFKMYCEGRERYSNPKLPVIIVPHGSNHKLVKQYQRGRCYAAIFTADMSDEEIQDLATQGQVQLQPYDESGARFLA